METLTRLPGRPTPDLATRAQMDDRLRTLCVPLHLREETRATLSNLGPLWRGVRTPAQVFEATWPGSVWPGRRWERVPEVGLEKVRREVRTLLAVMYLENLSAKQVTDRAGMDGRTLTQLALGRTSGLTETRVALLTATALLQLGKRPLTEVLALLETRGVGSGVDPDALFELDGAGRSVIVSGRPRPPAGFR